MKFKYLFLLICLIALSKCSSNKSRNEYGFIALLNKEYNSGKSQFKDSLLVLFPEFIDSTDLSDGLRINSSYKDTPKDLLYLSVYKEITKNDSIIIEKYRYNSTVYELRNSCLLFIDNNVNRYGFDRNREDRSACDQFVPVPDESLFVLDDYPKDMSFYIFQCQQGVFSDDLEIFNRKYLPEEWRNGFSTGFALGKEKQVILYWVMIW